jgi:hypothetical protein
MKGYYNSDEKNLLLIQNWREALINIESFQIKIGKKISKQNLFLLSDSNKINYILISEIIYYK